MWSETYMPPYPRPSHSLAMGRIWLLGRKATAWWKRTGVSVTVRASAGPGGQRCAPDGGRRCEGDRDVLGPVDEVRLQALHLTVEAHVGDALEEAVEHHHDLHAGQVRPQAEVRPASAEGDVVVGGAGDVERVGVLERRFVAVGRGVPEGDLVALLDLLAVQFHAARGRAAEVHDGRDVPEHLLDGARQ